MNVDTPKTDHTSSAAASIPIFERSDTRSAEITQEAIKQAALDITQEIQSSAEQEQPKTSIYSAVKSWVGTQMARAGQALIALALAALVATVTPLLVKYEVAGEIQTLSHEFFAQLENEQSATSALYAQASAISSSTQTLNQQSDEILATFAQLQQSLDDIRLAISSSPDIEGQQARIESNIARQNNQLQAFLLDLDSRIDTLSIKVEQSSTPQAKTHSLKPLVAKIDEYIRRGRDLLGGPLQQETFEPWLGETHYFVSLVSSQHLDLKEIKTEFKSVYRGQKDYRDAEDRVRSAILLLGALKNGIEASAF